MKRHVTTMGRLAAEYALRLRGHHIFIWMLLLALSLTVLTMMMFILYLHGHATAREIAEIGQALERVFYIYLGILFGFPALEMMLRRIPAYRRLSDRFEQRMDAFEESLP